MRSVVARECTCSGGGSNGSNNSSSNANASSNSDKFSKFNNSNIPITL